MVHIFLQKPILGINNIVKYVEPSKIINFYNGFCYFLGDREKRLCSNDFNKYLPLTPYRSILHYSIIDQSDICYE